jgi:hypothetical protein
MVLDSGGVLGVGPVAPTEYLITRLELGHLPADRFDPPGNIHAAYRHLGFTQSESAVPAVGSTTRWCGAVEEARTECVGMGQLGSLAEGCHSDAADPEFHLDVIASTRPTGMVRHQRCCARPASPGTLTAFRHRPSPWDSASVGS